MSATENIDETPSGMLLHGIMSRLPEFYSRNLATEVVKGLSQKAAQGGTVTVTKAPSVTATSACATSSGVRCAPSRSTRERAWLVRWRSRCSHPVNWTTSQLPPGTAARALTTAASPRRPSGAHRQVVGASDADEPVLQRAASATRASPTPGAQEPSSPNEGVGPGADRARHAPLGRRCDASP